MALSRRIFPDQPARAVEIRKQSDMCVDSADEFAWLVNARPFPNQADAKPRELARLCGV
jgi:hypothetical protein